MKLYYPITIDLYKVHPLKVMEAQQGNVGRGAVVTLTAGGAVVDPTGETVEVYAKKPDGTVSWLECSIEDTKIKVDFTNQILMSPGTLQVELRMMNDTDDITTPIFMVNVNKSNVQSAGRSENELPLLDQIKKNAEDAKKAAEAAEAAVGDKITNPDVGAVGQILEIETVDDEGKPLTYKAVEKPTGGTDSAVQYITQTLSEDQKTQARSNIGAAAASEVSKLSEDIATKASAIKEKASGELIVVTDSDERKPLGLAIDGKSEQNQYSGNQLIDISKVSKYPSTGYVANDTGSLIKVSDTISRGKIYYPIDISLLTGMEVKLSAKISKSISDVAIFVGAVITSPSGNTYHNLVTSDLSGVKTKTFVIPSDATSMNVDINVNDTGNTLSTANTVTVENLMLCLSSVTDDTFEPFVGGKPSPSTEYEQKIRNIGVYDEASGKYAVEVKFAKGNLFDKNNKDLISNTYINQSANLLGYTIDNLDHSVLLEVIPNTTYTISVAESSRLRVALTKEKLNESVNSSVSVNGINADGEKSLTISTGKDDRYLYINLSNDETEFLKIIDTLMINYGSTALPHEEYKETTATVYLDEPLRKGDKAYWNGGKLRIDRYSGVATENDFTEIQALNTFGRFVIDTLPPLDITKPLKCTKFKGVNFDGRSNYSIYPESGRNVWTCAFKTDSTENSITNVTINDIKENIIIEYTLAEPITEEIDIDLGELTMFYPTTIISNDCNANMEVTYIADTKAYIDKKFAELATAMV